MPLPPERTGGDRNPERAPGKAGISGFQTPACGRRIAEAPESRSRDRDGGGEKMTEVPCQRIWRKGRADGAGSGRSRTGGAGPEKERRKAGWRGGNRRAEREQGPKAGDGRQGRAGPHRQQSHLATRCRSPCAARSAHVAHPASSPSPEPVILTPEPVILIGFKRRRASRLPACCTVPSYPASAALPMSIIPHRVQTWPRRRVLPPTRRRPSSSTEFIAPGRSLRAELVRSVPVFPHLPRLADHTSFRSTCLSANMLAERRIGDEPALRESPPDTDLKS